MNNAQQPPIKIIKVTIGEELVVDKGWGIKDIRSFVFDGQVEHHVILIKQPTIATQ